MDVLFWIIAMTILDGLVALVGTLTLVLSKQALNKLVFPLVAFSSGALFSGALFHMTAESLEHEGIVRWHHCHENECDAHIGASFLIHENAR